MNKIEVLFLGNSDSGKSYLINRFRTGRYGPNYDDGTGTYYLTTQKEDIRYSIWDIDGNMLERLVPRFITEATDICVYTLDLSAPLNNDLLNEHIRLIRETNPNLPILLVGCKSDAPREIEDEAFANIQEFFGIEQAVITSALTGEGIEQFTMLLNQTGVPNKLVKILQQEKEDMLTIKQIKFLLVKEGPLYKAIQDLEKLIKELPPRQEAIINEAMIKLVADLYQGNSSPETAINNFVQASEDALAQLSKTEIAKDIIKRTRRGILLVAAAATLTVFVAAICFGASFVTAALLFTGLMAAGTSCLVAKASFFSPMPKALNKVCTEAANKNENFIQANNDTEQLLLI